MSTTRTSGGAPSRDRRVRVRRWRRGPGSGGGGVSPTTHSIKLKIQVPIIAKTPGSSLELHLRTRRREDPAIEIYANGIAVRRARGKDGARSPEGDRCVGPPRPADPPHRPRRRRVDLAIHRCPRPRTRSPARRLTDGPHRRRCIGDRSTSEETGFPIAGRRDREGAAHRSRGGTTLKNLLLAILALVPTPAAAVAYSTCFHVVPPDSVATIQAARP